jgi:hypothetical protein
MPSEQSKERRKSMRKKPSNRRSANDYKVGRGRPPESSRWKPGQSGNPKGRPKGAKGFPTIFDEVLKQTFEVQEKGRTRRITAREAMVRRVVSDALKGSIKALAFVFAMAPKVARTAAAVPTITRDMTAKEALNLYEQAIKGIDEEE